MLEWYAFSTYKTVKSYAESVFQRDWEADLQKSIVYHSDLSMLFCHALQYN